MLAPIAFLANLASDALLLVVSASPAQRPISVPQSTVQRHSRYYDVQVCWKITSSMRFRIHSPLRPVLYRPTEEVEGTLSRTRCPASLGLFRDLGRGEDEADSSVGAS